MMISNTAMVGRIPGSSPADAGSPISSANPVNLARNESASNLNGTSDHEYR